MEKETYWQEVCETYPQFKNENEVIKLTGRGLRALVEQALQVGYESGQKDTIAAIKAMQSDKPKQDNPFNDMFKGFF